MTSPPPDGDDAVNRRRQTAAARQRRCRHRNKHALVSLRHLDMDVAGIDRLVELGLLDEREADDESAVEAAAARALAKALGIKFYPLSRL